jgi:hypothetical protein
MIIDTPPHEIDLFTVKITIKESTIAYLYHNLSTSGSIICSVLQNIRIEQRVLGNVLYCCKNSYKK